MKMRCLHWACFLLSLFVTCLSFGAGVAAGAEVTPAEIMQAYADVLLGQRSYIQCNVFDGGTEEAFMQEQIGMWYGYIFEVPLRFEGFAAADPDADGNPELLLKLSDEFGYELLRYQAGQVYGYPFIARAMEDITIDGEIHGSNGAQNYGWYRVAFDAETLTTANVCWMYDDRGADLVYTIGDATVTEAEFDALSEQLWNKESLVFTEYTPEALAAAVAAW